MGKPKRSPYQKKEMPFAASRLHQYWSADVRYVKKHKLGRALLARELAILSCSLLYALAAR